jgi:3-hydroxyacyl-CoA dehydrogenase/enoyl-CoA hydratase/3-hydroxybutyryl-CoA epimerase
MQLVEIIAASQTSPEVVATAVRFVQQIGKLPVVVKDSPGFVVNRILMPYLVEAGRLFELGASVRDLDEAMLDFGMPMGPMRLLDEVGIDVALHVAQTLALHFQDRMMIPDVLTKMVKAGLLGRKSGRGFYVHSKGKEPQLNSDIPGFQQYPPRSDAFARATLEQRMVLLMVNESAQCLEEQIVGEPADIDFAMIMGTGFAPFRGGPLRYADSVGVSTLLGQLEAQVAAGNRHFQPSVLLRKMVGSGRKFYPND